MGVRGYVACADLANGFAEVVTALLVVGIATAALVVNGDCWDTSSAACKQNTHTYIHCYKVSKNNVYTPCGGGE